MSKRLSYEQALKHAMEKAENHSIAAHGMGSWDEEVFQMGVKKGLQMALAIYEKAKPPNQEAK